MPRSLILRTLLTLLLLTPLAACDNGSPGGDDGGGSAVGREVFGPTAAYDRRLVFLGPGAELPTAAIFDFTARSDSAGLHRNVRVRLADGTEWVPLLDEGWEMEAMREPWRLVPRGPLRVVVGEAGELDALLFRGEVDMRLETGPVIAEYSPDPGTQLVLRQGRLRLGDEPVAGILLDAQLARALTPGDSASSPAAGAEALLLDNSGYYAVFAAPADGATAWVHSGGRDNVHPAARLEPTSFEAYAEAGSQAPVAWRVASPAGELGGELRAEAASRVMLDGDTLTEVLGYVIVTGWIEDRGVRRNVYGLIRHVR